MSSWRTPSRRCAPRFAAGADVVELDIHLTPDKVFAVLHDWTLDCRTDGHGVTEQTPWPILKTLDVGYGYTADGGKTFPLRGKGVGLMPRLDEVYAAFPDGSFLINFKSRRTEEGEVLATMLNADPRARAATFGVYGGEEPTRTAEAAATGLKGFDKASLKACLVRLRSLWLDRHPARRPAATRLSFCRSISLLTSGAGPTASCSACATPTPT